VAASPLVKVFSYTEKPSLPYSIWVQGNALVGPEPSPGDALA